MDGVSVAVLGLLLLLLLSLLAGWLVGWLHPFYYPYHITRLLPSSPFQQKCILLATFCFSPIYHYLFLCLSFLPLPSVSLILSTRFLFSCLVEHSSLISSGHHPKGLGGKVDMQRKRTEKKKTQDRPLVRALNK